MALMKFSRLMKNFKNILIQKILRTCSRREECEDFGQDFVDDKAKIHRHTRVWQEFLTQSAAKISRKDLR